MLQNQTNPKRPRMKSIITLCALLLSVSFTFADADKPKPPGDGKKPPGENGKPPGENGKPRGNPEEHFKKLDANGDGEVSKAEHDASPMAQKDPERANKSFEHRDKDKNGSLSKEEFLAPRGGRPDKKEGKN